MPLEQTSPLAQAISPGLRSTSRVEPKTRAPECSSLIGPPEHNV